MPKNRGLKVCELEIDDTIHGMWTGMAWSKVQSTMLARTASSYLTALMEYYGDRPHEKIN